MNKICIQSNFAKSVRKVVLWMSEKNINIILNKKLEINQVAELLVIRRSSLKLWEPFRKVFLFNFTD
jgi:hypothetical protein